jgi:hypothetical protein
MSEVNSLLAQLIVALRTGGHVAEVAKLERWKHDLLSGTMTERVAAAEAISANCHVKAWGDLNFEIPGSDRNRELTLLAKIKTAVLAEVTK